jgi:hypothetical protein
MVLFADSHNLRERPFEAAIKGHALGHLQLQVLRTQATPDWQGPLRCHQIHSASLK